jgi:hypothetical protein
LEKNAGKSFTRDEGERGWRYYDGKDHRDWQWLELSGKKISSLWKM